MTKAIASRTRSYRMDHQRMSASDVAIERVVAEIAAMNRGDRPRSDYRALVCGLYLGLVAPTDAAMSQVVPLVESVARSLTAEQVERAKAEAVAMFAG